MLLNHGKNGTYYCSHKTICLNLFSIINSFDNNINQMISIETDTKLVSKSTPYSFQKYEYQHRPIEMEDICFYDFISLYKKTTKQKLTNKIKKQGKTIVKRFDYLESHTEYSTRQLIEKKEIDIPIILYSSIPRKHDFKNKELYAKIVLSLFKPWRLLTDLTEYNGNLFNLILIK